MKTRKKENLHPGGLSNPLTSKQEDFKFDLNGSQSSTLTQPPFGLKEAERAERTTIEYHLTISIPNSSLTPRDLSLLLEVLNYQAVHFGVNLVMYLAMLEIYFRLLGSKSNPLEVKDKYIRLTLSVTEIICREFKGKDFSLSPEHSLQVSQQIREILLRYLMSKRTYGSRFRTWRPEKFLAVRIVPVDTIFERRPGSTRYSSYCKGYGESGPSARRKKLKPQPELDARDVRSPDEVQEDFLFARCSDPVHLLTESLWIRYRNLLEDET